MTQENVGPEAGYFKYFINTALQGNMVCVKVWILWLFWLFFLTIVLHVYTLCQFTTRLFCLNNNATAIINCI